MGLDAAILGHNHLYPRFHLLAITALWHWYF